MVPQDLKNVGLQMLSIRTICVSSYARPMASLHSDAAAFLVYGRRLDAQASARIWAFVRFAAAFVNICAKLSVEASEKC